MVSYVSQSEPRHDTFSVSVKRDPVLPPQWLVRCLRKPPDTLLKIAPQFSYAVESPGSWVTVGESPSRFSKYFIWRQFSPAVLPAKKACGIHPLRHFGVRQQYPDIILIPRGEPPMDQTLTPAQQRARLHQLLDTLPDAAVAAWLQLLDASGTPTTAPHGLRLDTASGPGSR
jgi:hypothetical protein